MFSRSVLILAKDEQFHLTGATQIVNSMHSLDFSRGLSEASAWLCLRQDIYISINHQVPLRTNLSAFADSETLKRRGDTAYAARMVFLLGKAVACANSEDTRTKTERLGSVSREVEEWFNDKPLTFMPIRHIPRDAPPLQAFPDIWMSQPCHGMQSLLILNEK